MRCAESTFASNDTPTQRTVAMAGSEHSLWDETSLIGKVFIAFGTLLTLFVVPTVYLIVGVNGFATFTQTGGSTTINGTGTIDDEGNVGPIGGVPQKLVAAKRDGAKIFLTPAGNCAEAVANAVPGLPMARVATLDDALGALKAVREHRQPALCPR